MMEAANRGARRLQEMEVLLRGPHFVPKTSSSWLVMIVRYMKFSTHVLLYKHAVSADNTAILKPGKLNTY